MEVSSELKMGNLTMDAYKKIFIELLSYVDYIKYEKVKIQIFLRGLTNFYVDKI